MENEVIKPKWLEKLEIQTNKKLKKAFPNAKITDLNLQYGTKEKLGEIDSGEMGVGQLVLTGSVTANYNHNFEILGDKQKEADRIVSETLHKKLTSIGIW